MSFLYKALLKEQKSNEISGDSHSNASSDVGYQAEFHSNNQSFAQSSYAEPTTNVSKNSNNHVHWGAWLVIALLLLVVGLLGGLLGGYLLGQKTNTSVLQPVSQSIAQAASQPVTQSATTPESSYLTAENNQSVNQSSKEPTSAQPSNTKILEKANNEQPIEVNNINTSKLSVDDVPKELQESFAKAQQEAAKSQADKEGEIKVYDNHFNVEVDSTLTNINELDESEQALLPQMVYQMHIFSSDPNERWVRINDKTLYEGDRFTPHLKLAEIRQDKIIWESKYHRFSQTALVDYN